jgi:uncharacterized membrane protein
MAKHMKSLMVMVGAILSMQLLIGLSDTYAHGKEKHPKSSTVHATESDSSRAKKTTDHLSSNEEQPFVFEPLKAAREHLHNKFIHVPVGFALAAFAVSLLSFRRKELQPAVRVLVLIAAVGAVFAYFTGVVQAREFEGGPEQWVVDLHKWLGISTAVLLWVWAVFLSLRRLERYALAVGLGVVLLVLVTGFFGGILAHA